MKEITIEFEHRCKKHGGKEYSGLIRPCSVCGKLCNIGILHIKRVK